FVMELVRGVPITDFCDQARLPVRARLELFVCVCQAVQHAHQKGIIHRDLKPSNVLVTRQDDKPVVKVIDFGIAKALGQQLTDKTLCTGNTQLIGTPLYVSPEQAQMSGLDVDTRSDVYSLGVLLYELLTGTTPFDQERLRTAGYDELRRIIREEEPPRPSTRLSTLGQAASTVAANRKTEAKRLSRLVRGELDWVVMKALEKDPNRRYESASAFAADVQRYLADEPVLACPSSAGHRLREFVQRHRGPVLAGAAVRLALVAGIVGTTLGLVEARRQRDLTEQARKDADKNAEKAREEEGQARAARDAARQLAADEKAAHDRAEKQRLRAEWVLYARRINLARQARENNNAFLAFHYLAGCPGGVQGGVDDFGAGVVQRDQRRCGTQVSRGGGVWKISSVAVSPDGKRLVSGNYDRTVKVWDADTGRETLTIQKHWGSVLSVAFTPDGKR